jgi:nitroreductase
MTLPQTASPCFEDHSTFEAFKAIALGRKSVRAFLPDPVPEDMIRDVFNVAQWGPSNCNTQPWKIVIASGSTLERLREAHRAELTAGVKLTPDLPYQRDLYPPDFLQRMSAHHAAMGVPRGDKAGQMDILRRNLEFFGAPHAAYLYMPNWGNEREASDLGMFAQSVLLGLSARGLAACPQTVLGLFAGPARRVLEIDPSWKLLFGIAFGYADDSQPLARLEQDRVEFDAAITFSG